jgi:hypothetical protein
MDLSQDERKPQRVDDEREKFLSLLSDAIQTLHTLMSARVTSAFDDVLQAPPGILSYNVPWCLVPSFGAYMSLGGGGLEVSPPPYGFFVKGYLRSKIFRKKWHF